MVCNLNTVTVTINFEFNVCNTPKKKVYQRHVYHCVASLFLLITCLNHLGTEDTDCLILLLSPLLLRALKSKFDHTYKIQLAVVLSRSVETLLSDKQTNKKIMYFIAFQKKSKLFCKWGLSFNFYFINKCIIILHLLPYIIY